MNRTDILDAARDCITRDRAATHGEAEDSFARIAALWSADLGVALSAVDVARLMALFKIARAKGNPSHQDNWVDGAGYMALGGEIATRNGAARASKEPTGYAADLPSGYAPDLRRCYVGTFSNAFYLRDRTDVAAPVKVTNA